MAVLSIQKILQENNASNPNSITSLSLTHRALSDVSCLSEFKNLEKLDLSFNSLTSLVGLKSCVNLKWLSVVQNKLQSLKGIEGLTQLTVLNAGKNRLKSMDEIKALATLRALILNDNEINSVCKLDQLKNLNTLVLSRNPISSLGESLVKLKSITKLSLSNCQLRTVSLKSCSELKEIRLAHNEIMTVPNEFSLLVKLQNLDMGNNLITSWSDLKVLSSLIKLRNLNLQGNPVTEKKNLAKKVKKLLPNLRIFNAKPIEKVTGKEEHGELDSSAEGRKDSKSDLSLRKKNSNKAFPLSDSKDGPLDNVGQTVDETKKKRKKLADSMENSTVLEKRGKKLRLQDNDELNENINEVGKSKSKKQKKDKHGKGKSSDTITTGKDADKKSLKSIKKDDLNSVIDSSAAPFADLFDIEISEIPPGAVDKKLDNRTNQAINAISESATLPNKKMKRKNRGVDPAALELSRADEIGLGGPSAWE